jgi:hypothetical protein
MRGCEDEKMFYRPPLLEEPCAQTLSGMMIFLSYVGLPKGRTPFGCGSNGWMPNHGMIYHTNSDRRTTYPRLLPTPDISGKNMQRKTKNSHQQFDSLLMTLKNSRDSRGCSEPGY